MGNVIINTIVRMFTRKAVGKAMKYAGKGGKAGPKKGRRGKRGARDGKHVD